MLSHQDSATSGGVSRLFSSSLQPLFNPVLHIRQSAPTEDEELTQGIPCLFRLPKKLQKYLDSLPRVA